MIRKLYVQSRKKEDGAGLLVFWLLMFMITFTIFGLGIDLALVRSAQSSVQSTLDAATAAGVTQLVTNKNTVDADGATELGHEFYAENRKGILGLNCMTSAHQTKAKAQIKKSGLMSDDNDCLWIKARETVSKNEYRLATYECVSTVFIKPLMPEFCFFTDSTARTSQVDN